MFDQDAGVGSDWEIRTIEPGTLGRLRDSFLVSEPGMRGLRRDMLLPRALPPPVYEHEKVGAQATAYASWEVEWPYYAERCAQIEYHYAAAAETPGATESSHSEGWLTASPSYEEHSAQPARRPRLMRSRARARARESSDEDSFHPARRRPFLLASRAHTRKSSREDSFEDSVQPVRRPCLRRSRARARRESSERSESTEAQSEESYEEEESESYHIDEDSEEYFSYEASPPPPSRTALVP